jgi:hypothetical protein
MRTSAHDTPSDAQAAGNPVGPAGHMLTVVSAVPIALHCLIAPLAQRTAFGVQDMLQVAPE